MNDEEQKATEDGDVDVADKQDKVDVSEKDTEVKDQASKQSPDIDPELSRYEQFIPEAEREAYRERLKSGYLRQADYTQKTQGLAAKQRLLDEYEKSKPILDKLFTRPELLNELLGKGKKAEEEDAIPEDPREFYNKVKNDSTKASVEEIRNFLGVERDIEAAGQVDPRLSADEEFATVIARMVRSDPEVTARRKSFVAATKEAVALYDSLRTKEAARIKKEMSDKVKETRQFSESKPSPLPTTGHHPKTMREAAAMAEDELSSR